MKVLPEAFSDFVDVLEASSEEGDEVDGGDLIAQDDGEFVDGSGEGASNGDVLGGAELVVVGAKGWPALTTAGESDGGELKKKGGEGSGRVVEESERRKC